MNHGPDTGSTDGTGLGSEDPGSGSDRAGADSTDADRTDADRTDADRTGSGESGPSGSQSNEPGSDVAGSNRLGSNRLGSDGLGSDGLGADELALRRLLHRAVDEIEPRDGTLDHLRRAVPARRARKRQALVGMAAAVLFVGTAIPAVVHVSTSTGSGANTAAVGNSQDAQGSRGQGRQEEGSTSSAGSSAGSSAEEPGKKGGGEKEDKDEGMTDGGKNPTATPSPDTTQICTAAQLGGATAVVGEPDAAGAVYGTFRVANVSGDSCTVSGTGGVSPTAQGAADPSKVSVTGHVAGDAATGLPDPSLAAAQLALQPGAAYEVKFAWVPSEACPTTGGGGGTTDPSPDPSPTGSAPDSGGTVPEDTGTTTQLLTADGVAEGSVAVTHTAEGGVPSVTATVGNACAGTVYWTGLLAGA